MKRNLLFFIVLFIAQIAVSQNISKYAPQVVLIGIGEKNASLSESDFPDLKFYYTPEIKLDSKAGATGQAIVNMTNLAKFSVNGSPEFLVNLWNEREKDKAFFLFDKKGICATQGYEITRQGGDIASRNCIDKKTLNDHLVDIVKKDNEAKPAKKEINLKKSDFMIGQTFPEFNVSDSEGNSVLIQSVIKDKPTLVVLYHLPADIDINAGKKSFKGESGKSFMKAMVASASGASDIDFFKNMQYQFFK